MPLSVLTYIATIAVQNKNLIERMKFVKYFFVARVSSIALLALIDTYSYKGKIALNKRLLF